MTTNDPLTSVETSQGPHRHGPHVIVVEDDTPTRVLVLEILRRAGIEATGVSNGEEATRLARTTRPDLVLLDLGLPGRDGATFVAELRHEAHVPVIVLTGRAGTEDKVRGLEDGADDYVVKPVDGRELVARVRAVLRRNASAAGPGARDELEPDRFSFDDLEIDVASRTVVRRGARVALTAKEFDLLVLFAAHPHRTHTREEILAEVWNSTPDTSAASTVNEHVRRLRLKLEDSPRKPRWIVTVPGLGYRFEP